jgi:hypothetical protein
VARLDENTKGGEIELSAEDVEAIRNLSESAEVAGERYPVNLQQEAGGNCVTLAQYKVTHEA